MRCLIAQTSLFLLLLSNIQPGGSRRIERQVITTPCPKGNSCNAQGQRKTTTTTTATTATTTPATSATQTGATTTVTVPTPTTTPPTNGSTFVWGDPHYASFDGTWNHYQGTCKLRYMECEAPGLDAFKIYTKSEPWDYEPSKSLLESLELLVGSSLVVLGKNNVVTVDGETRTMSLGSSDWNFQFRSTNATAIIYANNISQVIVQASFGLTIYWSPAFPVSLYIVVIGAYKEKCKGLTGPWNGDPTDDFLKPDSTNATSTDEFGDSWKVDPLCQNDPRTDSRDPCNANATLNAQAGTECAAITNPMGPFKNCLAVPGKAATADRIYESCKYDTCAALAGGRVPTPLSCGAKEMFKKVCAPLCIDQAYFQDCCKYAPTLCDGSSCGTTTTPAFTIFNVAG